MDRGAWQATVYEVKKKSRTEAAENVRHFFVEIDY